MKNQEIEVKHYQRAAELGVVRAMHNLSFCYDLGQGIQKDYSEAYKLIFKSAEDRY